MANEWDSRIEDYLDNLMNEEERKSFETAMQNDKALKKQVAIIQEINQTIGLEGKFQEFQETINTLNQRHFSTEQTDNTSKKSETVVRQLTPQRRFFAIAAAFIAFVVSAVLIWSTIKSETISTEELFASNYEPYNIGQRSGSDNLNETEKTAFKNYTDGNFENAIVDLEPLVVINPTEENYLLSLGSAYVSTQQTNKAISTFQKINNTSVNYQVAQWYLALAYLQNDDVDNAKAILTTLAKGERTYAIKAKALLKEF